MKICAIVIFCLTIIGCCDDGNSLSSIQCRTDAIAAKYSASDIMIICKIK